MNLTGYADMGKAWYGLLHIAAPNTSLAMRCFFTVAALLSGCDESPVEPDTFAVMPVAAMPQIPPERQLRIKLPPGTFTTVDFMALHGCALQITLGKYQSRLGRFASDSQRLLLDLEYLSLAPDCIALQQSKQNHALAEQLQQEKKLKRQQLPSRIFNAIFANTEFQQFWDRHSRCCDNADQYRLTLTSLEDISASVQRWLSGDYRASNIDFEIQLSEVAKGSAAYMQSGVMGQFLTRLEAQLQPVLPLEYQRWRQRRDTVLQDLHRE